MFHPLAAYRPPMSEVGPLAAYQIGGGRVKPSRPLYSAGPLEDCEVRPPIEVPLLDLRAEQETLRAELDAAIARVLDSQRFILGPEVEALESELAALCGAREAVACASGSDALLLCLMALGVGAGDEVRLRVDRTRLAVVGRP